MNSSEVNEWIVDFTVAALNHELNSASIADFKPIKVGKPCWVHCFLSYYWCLFRSFWQGRWTDERPLPAQSWRQGAKSRWRSHRGRKRAIGERLLNQTGHHLTRWLITTFCRSPPSATMSSTSSQRHRRRPSRTGSPTLSVMDFWCI